SRAACQVARSTTGGRPGSAVAGSSGVVVMVSSVVSRAGSVVRRPTPPRLGRQASGRPSRDERGVAGGRASCTNRTITARRRAAANGGGINGSGVGLYKTHRAPASDACGLDRVKEGRDAVDAHCGRRRAEAGVRGAGAGSAG